MKSDRFPAMNRSIPYAEGSLLQAIGLLLEQTILLAMPRSSGALREIVDQALLLSGYGGVRRITLLMWWIV